MRKEDARLRNPPGDLQNEGEKEVHELIEENFIKLERPLSGMLGTARVSDCRFWNIWVNMINLILGMRPKFKHKIYLYFMYALHI